MSAVKVIPIAKFQQKATIRRPLFVSAVSAGFPSPADDYIDRSLDLNEFLVEHPASTFFVRVQGDSMIGAGIHDGDILVVDRSAQPTDKKIVIAIVEGELTVKRLRMDNDNKQLVPENPQYAPIDITAGCEIWGVVTSVIRKV